MGALPEYLIKMAAEFETELCMNEEASNVSVEFPKNLNWMNAKKGQQFFFKLLKNVNNPENEISESSAARTI